jgi:hypothetical protein
VRSWGKTDAEDRRRLRRVHRSAHAPDRARDLGQSTGTPSSASLFSTITPAASSAIGTSKL